MNKNPLVSIIIPTYKSDRTLKRAIDSCLNQTYKNIEIIVVDDNDPKSNYRKNTENIMKEYEKNKKVKYIKHEKNKNGAAARNTGFKISKGEYISFLDDDDIFMETKIEKQVNFLENNLNYHAVYCWRYQNNRIIKSNRTGDLSRELLTLEFTPYTSSILLRRECYEVLNGFDEHFRRHQDYEFLLRFFELYKIGVVKEPLVKIVGNGVDNSLHGKDLEILKEQFLRKFDSYINKIDNIEKNFKKTVYSRHYSVVFWNYFKQGSLNNAFRIFILYFRRYNFIFLKSLLRQLFRYLRVKINKNFNVLYKESGALNEYISN